MKSILLLATLLIHSLALAEDPKELVTLRRTYELEAKRLMQPLNERYLRSLAQLKNSYTTSAKLEEAIAIQAEIKRILGASTSTADPTESPNHSPALLDTKWVGRSGRGSGKILVFQANGVMTVLKADNSHLYGGWVWGTDEHGKPWIKASNDPKEPIRFTQKNKRLTMSWGDFELQTP